MRPLSLAAVAAVALLTGPDARAAFFPINPLAPGSGSTYAYGVADGGRAAIGFVAPNSGSGYSFRWTPAGGPQPLDMLNGGQVYGIRGISADGNTVVGAGGPPGGGFVPYRWTTAAGATYLPVRPGGSGGQAQGVSADGSVVVGDADATGAPNGEAFRYTTAGGYRGLGVLPGDQFSSALAASADGSVVVGVSGLGNPFSPSSPEAFRWENGVIEGLGVLPGLFGSRATGVSGDGSVVVGTSLGNPFGAPPDRAFIWTRAGGLQELGTIPPVFPGQFVYSRAEGISGDGRLVVGSSNGSAAIWDRTNGFRPLQDLLTAQGDDLAGYTLIDATDISPDGTAVSGVASSPRGQLVGFVATFAAPAAVPEPASAVLLAAGGLGLLGYARRRGTPARRV